MIANVRQSTGAALKALRLFRQSLVTAGLKEGVASYRAMCDTLYSQSVWMLDKHDDETAANFDELRSTARSIVDILEPYTTALGKLAELPTLPMLEQDTVEADGSDPLVGPAFEPASGARTAEDRVVVFLTDAGSRSSASRIRAGTGLRRAELEGALAILQREGRVVARRVSGRDLFELT